MTSFKTTAYIETTETQLQGVVDAIMGKDLSAWVCDYPFGTGGPEIIALEGNLGAGKTTLISILAGLTRATSGVTQVQGCDVQTQAAQAMSAELSLEVGA